EGLWGFTWLVVGALGFAASAVVRLPFQTLWTTPLVGFGALFFFLPYVREGPYRAAPGDSGNRMLMHVLLVAVLYLVVAAGWNLSSEPTTPALPGPDGAGRPPSGLGSADRPG
ncbi:MAG: hypothetical protein ACRDVM_08990, partial [Acidimicrobiia bacterium]